RRPARQIERLETRPKFSAIAMMRRIMRFKCSQCPAADEMLSPSGQRVGLSMRPQIAYKSRKTGIAHAEPFHIGDRERKTTPLQKPPPMAPFATWGEGGK